MVEPINLNRARKARATAEAKAKAAANRMRFGRTGAQKAAERIEASRDAATLDGAKRDD